MKRCKRRRRTAIERQLCLHSKFSVMYYRSFDNHIIILNNSIHCQAEEENNDKARISGRADISAPSQS